MIRSTCFAVALFLAAACGSSDDPAAPAQSFEGESDAPLSRGAEDEVIEAIWVTRFDFLTADDVERVIDNCERAGFDRIIFQVRGNATAFYESPYEPWAEQLGWANPGFDPLALAVELAHARGLELHAWINVIPAWWGPTLPESREHLWYTQPGWFWFDQYGKRQALSEKFYVSLNPALPAVREYLTRVVRDLAERYAIDGLHLDYIRFPNEPPAIPSGSGFDYPRDRDTLALFALAHDGATPETAPEAWNTWRTSRITLLLEEIRSNVKEVRPEVVLSAAVGSEPKRALEHFQDSEDWLARGLVDAIYPMNYTSDRELFESRVAAWQERAGDVELVMGVMVGSGDLNVRLEEIRHAQREVGAICVFAYSSLFDSSNDTIDSQDEETRLERAQRREAILPLLLPQ